MNKQTLNAVALRYRALHLGINREGIDMISEVSAPVIAFVARLKENGFSVSEELLHALCTVSANDLSDITDTINDAMGVNLNWAPIVKGWDLPTGESHIDHIVTLFANVLVAKRPALRARRLHVAVSFLKEHSHWSVIMVALSAEHHSKPPATYSRDKAAN